MHRYVTTITILGGWGWGYVQSVQREFTTFIRVPISTIDVNTKKSHRIVCTHHTCTDRQGIMDECSDEHENEWPLPPPPSVYERTGDKVIQRVIHQFGEGILCDVYINALYVASEWTRYLGNDIRCVITVSDTLDCVVDESVSIALPRKMAFTRLTCLLPYALQSHKCLLIAPTSVRQRQLRQCVDNNVVRECQIANTETACTKCKPVWMTVTYNEDGSHPYAIYPAHVIIANAGALQGVLTGINIHDYDAVIIHEAQRFSDTTLSHIETALYNANETDQTNKRVCCLFFCSVWDTYLCVCFYVGCLQMVCVQTTGCRQVDTNRIETPHSAISLTDKTNVEIA